MKLTENQKNCPYCHGYDTAAIFKGPFGFGLYVYADGSIAMYSLDDGMPSSILSKPGTIDYCPVCGRLLQNGDTD